MAALSDRVAALTLALVLSGCYATGPRFAGYDPISAGEGRLYVYRATEGRGDLSDFAFALDGTRFVNLGIGGYATVRLRPGVYALSAEPDGWGMNLIEPPIERDVRVVRGKAVFCRFSSSRGMLERDILLECSDDAEAHVELRECRLELLEADAPWDP